MHVIKYAFDAVYEISNVPIDLFGYTISLWNVFLFGVLGSLIFWFFKKLME